jgi:raffinose/stachyose/melibiose transport system substrate-binding protein
MSWWRPASTKGEIKVKIRSFKGRALALGLSAVLVVAACGSDDDGSADEPATEDSADQPATEDSADEPADGEVVELSFFMGNVEANVATAEALIAAFEEANPDIDITLDSSGPAGTEGDNLTKTKLATGEMEDLFWYNSGSLFQALDPDKTLTSMAAEPWVASLNEAYIQTVSTEAGGVYGAPAGSSTGGGVFYNIADYEELGLSVPTTWDEFMANNEALLDAGKVPVVQSFGDTWTSQLFVLADFFNVLANDPDWATKYTNNEAKYADDPVAMKGFQNGQDVYEAGLLNEDFAATTFDDALNMMGAGEATHYPMLTFAISTIVDLYPEAAENIGFFAMPGDGANGLTVWMRAAPRLPD